MNYCIPGELWNQIKIPSGDSTPVLVSTYISEIAYKLASITDVMMAKEMWHTVCEFAERCGSLIEYNIGSKTSGDPILNITPTFGRFQRAVGAKIHTGPVFELSVDRVSITEDSTGFAIEFPIDPERGNVTVSVIYSVVPDINAIPANQKVPMWFMKKYERLLVSGALMRIYAMSGERWSDPSLARMNATTYFREINRVTHGLITGGMRRQVLLDAESYIVKFGSTSAANSTSNNVAG